MSDVKAAFIRQDLHSGRQISYELTLISRAH